MDNGSHVNQVIAGNEGCAQELELPFLFLENGCVLLTFWSRQSSILRHAPGHFGLPWNQTLCDKPGRTRSELGQLLLCDSNGTEHVERCTGGTLSPNLHQVLLLHRGHLLWSPQFWHDARTTSLDAVGHGVTTTLGTMVWTPFHVNCCQLLPYLTDSQILHVTPNRRPGTWGAAVHRLAKQQKHSLRCSMATNLPGVQAMKLRMCATKKTGRNWMFA